MIETIIDKYMNDLKRLREYEVEFKQYEFELSDDMRNDVNQLNRLRVAIGLLNDIKIPDDYNLVKRLLNEEIKHRTSSTQNYQFEVVYLYFYLLSEFKNIADIWDFATLKFDGTMDADSGFETGFFLTYGKENLRYYLQNSTHVLKDKVYDKVYYNESIFSDKDGQAYKDQQKAYFGLIKPLQNVPGNYFWIQEKDGYNEAFINWKENADLSDQRIAYDYVIYSEYLENEEEIEKAMRNYIKIDPKSWLAKGYKKNLRDKQKKHTFPKKSYLCWRFIK
jgi:hypothetical protein